MRRAITAVLLLMTALALLCAGCAKEPGAPPLPSAQPASADDRGEADAPTASPEGTGEAEADPTPEPEGPPLPDLDGAWEPGGYVGPRAEISGNELVRLWRNMPVLTTTFTVTEEDGRFLLTLADNGLRNTPESDPYATVRECRYEDGAIIFVDDFPYSGESIEVLYPTTNSRYGNVTVADETVLPLLEGRWKDGASDHFLDFHGNTMAYGYVDYPIGETEILTVRHNSTGEIRIVEADPAVMDTVGMFGTMKWEDGVIRTYVPITDIAPSELLFHKEDASLPDPAGAGAAP